MKLLPGKVKKLKSHKRSSIKKIIIFASAFAAIGVITLFATQAATPGITVTVDSTLPNPTNVKAYGDDRVASITWDAPTNAAAKNIVGYYVTWGAGSTYTNARQTTYNVSQIQPLVNGTTYNVKVQSVQGSYTSVSVPDSYEPGTATEARANGKVSSGISTTVTPNSTRVDALKAQDTAFFDDFNSPAGGFDELKWNNAASTCVELSKGGTFINNQFHGHTQTRSGNCDRSQVINRPRAIFDISNRTEANPGIINFDFDGVMHGRDAWYIDLIPANARKNGVPIDITSHASVFDDTPSDPMMIRMEQQPGSITFKYYDANKVPQTINSTLSCPDFDFPHGSLENCDVSTLPKDTTAVVPEPVTTSCPHDYASPCLFPISNYRRHWTLQVSPTKIKLFIDGVRFWEGPMPAEFANITKYVVHNNLFSYNTGKMDDTLPATSLLHWDNFGFNGPAPTTVTHNYLGGGTSGTVPFLGRGTNAASINSAPRTDKVNIPDPIGTPTQARVMFTLNNNGPANYTWSANDHILVNGKKYSYQNPATSSEQLPVVQTYYGNLIAEQYVPFSDSIIINATDLKTGINEIALNIGSTISYMNVLNVHIELEYPKASAPAYTQPTSIFGQSNIVSAFQPNMSSHDNYLFIEQDMGLPSGTIDSGTPVDPPPTGNDTTKPTVTLTAPADNTSVVSGANVDASASASDNIGVSRVDFYIGNTKLGTDTTSPYTATLSTVGLSASNYTIQAIAYDAANNSQTSANRTLVVTEPPDTTKPSATLSNPVSGSTISNAINVIGSASDNKGVTQIELYVDGAKVKTTTSSPASYALNTGTLTNSPHTFEAWAYDAAGNVGKSAVVTATVTNTAPPDTTAPTNVKITAPANSATVSGASVAFTSTASDNVGVNYVEFYMNNAGATGSILIYTDSIAPYTFNLDTTKYANGDYTLVSKAYDAIPNSTVSTAVTIRINNGPPPDTTNPTISLSPAYTAGTQVAGTITLTASASDNIGVTKVEFLVDGAVSKSLTTAPYVYSLDTKTLTNASHTLTAKAYDAANRVGTTPTYTVSVNNASPAPTKSGDFTGDNKVDFHDLLSLLSQYGKSDLKYDLSGDGKVDFHDLLNLLSKYGK